MAISFFQKIRLVFRGWSRRREQQEQEFLRKNTGWGTQPAGGGQAPSPVPPDQKRTGGAPVLHIDLDGLQAAYLDASGVIAYYLDVANGEVVENRDGTTLDATRFKRVPMRKSEDDDRRAFIETVEAPGTKLALMKSVASPTFRSVLASDRATERAWYNFRNSCATAAIEQWLKQLGLR
ncbi:MAG TPA: hypothetical protein VF505_18080 [Thermoanaerobaculia bacterium]